VEFPIEEEKLTERRKRSSQNQKPSSKPTQTKGKTKPTRRPNKRLNRYRQRPGKNQPQFRNSGSKPQPDQALHDAQRPPETLIKEHGRDENHEVEECETHSRRDVVNPILFNTHIQIPKEKQIQQEKEPPGSNQEIADKILRQSKKIIEEKNFEAGRLLCEKAQIYAPKDARIQANISVCYWHQKDYSNCFEICKRIISNKELENLEEKLIYNTHKILINCALKMEKYEIALKCAKGKKEIPYPRNKETFPEMSRSEKRKFSENSPNP